MRGVAALLLAAAVVACQGGGDDGDDDDDASVRGGPGGACLDDEDCKEGRCGVRRGPRCADAAAEIACASGGAGEELVVPIEPPDPGPYFVLVDGAPGGVYEITVDAS